MLTSLFSALISKLESWGQSAHNTSSDKGDIDLSIGLSCFHEAPEDIIEMTVRLLSDADEDGWGRGGMNALRLVSKRLLRMVESCATMLTHLEDNGPESFPLALRRCVRIQHIKCHSRNLRSLEGCPDGLKSLDIYAYKLESLEPLRRCTQLESLTNWYAEKLIDLSPLSSCPRLKKLSLRYSPVADLSPLSPLALLEDLSIMGCINVTSLDPLSGLMNLRQLHCRGIDPQTSLLPLASCTGLLELSCNRNAVDHLELLERMPGVTKLDN